VLLLNDAHAGLLEMENVSVLFCASLAVGVNVYVAVAWTDVEGVPLMSGAVLVVEVRGLFRYPADAGSAVEVSIAVNAMNRNVRLSFMPISQHVGCMAAPLSAVLHEGADRRLYVPASWRVCR